MNVGQLRYLIQDLPDEYTIYGLWIVQHGTEIELDIDSAFSHEDNVCLKLYLSQE